MLFAFETGLNFLRDIPPESMEVLIEPPTLDEVGSKPSILEVSV